MSKSELVRWLSEAREIRGQKKFVPSFSTKSGWQILPNTVHEGGKIVHHLVYGFELKFFEKG